MRKVAVVFVAAVFVPSLVLAWLAVRSLRDQQFLLERQQSLLYQGVADGLARTVQETLDQYQMEFVARVSDLAGNRPLGAAKTFDERVRTNWPLAQVGFVVSLTGELLAPSPYDRPETRLFCADNGRFLANRESAEVYWNPKVGLNYGSYGNVTVANNLAPQAQSSSLANDGNNDWARRLPGNKVLNRSVIPQQAQVPQILPTEENQQQLSKIAASEAEFRQLIGEDNQGALARFVDNKLNVLFWCRQPPVAAQSYGKGGTAVQLVAAPGAADSLVFGAQLSLTRLLEGLRPLVQVEPALREEICVALLDDMARPVALSQSGFRAVWKRPFVATEIGETLPHWEVAVYLLNPAKLTQTARTLKLTFGLLILVLVLAIGVGSWLIVADLNRQLTLARQKTDFVSNVSHELKTPLTSIRMFSELLAEGRVTDAAKQRSYLGIITAETARLTRLINNVLDFARLERGEKKYQFQPCDIVAVVREAAETYRPNLEANGFRFTCELPGSPVLIEGDRDALAQVVVNLLSNAEKYSDSRKEITLRLTEPTTPLPFVEVQVLDRGLGVPPGCGEKIFEKFYRAHDSLSSGIQGSGLGLTLARQIARAHGGDVAHAPRNGGGSAFSLRLPRRPEAEPRSAPSEIRNEPA